VGGLWLKCHVNNFCDFITLYLAVLTRCLWPKSNLREGKHVISHKEGGGSGRGPVGGTMTPNVTGVGEGGGGGSKKCRKRVT
jgi:hypothetical protein